MRGKGVVVVMDLFIRPKRKDTPPPPRPTQPIINHAKLIHLRLGLRLRLARLHSLGLALLPALPLRALLALLLPGLRHALPLAAPVELAPPVAVLPPAAAAPIPRDVRKKGKLIVRYHPPPKPTPPTPKPKNAPARPVAAVVLAVLPARVALGLLGQLPLLVPAPRAGAPLMAAPGAAPALARGARALLAACVL